MQPEVIPLRNERGESGVFRRDLEIPSVFLSLDAAIDYVTVALHSSDRPTIDKPFVDAVVSWLQPDDTEESRSILEQIRRRWIEPYAMTNDDGLYQEVVSLSDILSDPAHAQAVLRSMYLESKARAGGLSRTNVPEGEVVSGRRGIVSFHEDDMGLGTDPSAREIYESFVGIKSHPRVTLPEEEVAELPGDRLEEVDPDAIEVSDDDLDDMRETNRATRAA